MGEPMALAANEGYPLLEQGIIYLVEKGSVNLYALKKRRFFLAHFQAGEVLFTLPSEDSLTFSVYAEEPTLLRQVALGELSDEQIKTWIQKLRDIIKIPPPDQRENLAPFHSQYVQSLDRQLIENEKETLERIEKKKAEKETLLSDLELKMSSLLTTSHPHPPPSQSDELLFQVFYLIAVEMGLDPQKPKEEIPSDEVSDHLEIYCKINRMRKRQVRLTKGVFKESSTHFLAFSKESGEPMALIKKRPGHYVADDLKEKRAFKVDSIEPFDPIAYVFYETLRKKSIRAPLLSKTTSLGGRKNLFPSSTTVFWAHSFRLQSPWPLTSFSARLFPMQISPSSSKL